MQYLHSNMLIWEEPREMKNHQYLNQVHAKNLFSYISMFLIVVGIGDQVSDRGFKKLWDFGSNKVREMESCTYIFFA